VYVGSKRGLVIQVARVLIWKNMMMNSGDKVVDGWWIALFAGVGR
jgi:hypothetical protein